MKPDEYLNELKKICKACDWDGLSELRLKTNQSFAANSDFSGLKEFYEKVIVMGLPSAKVEEALIENENLESFKSCLADVFTTAKSKLESREDIKGVYFEYFFDGGDCCSGDLFLCSSYSDDDDFWGAEFDEPGVIEGPSVFDYLNIDPDYEWEDFLRYVAEEYANGMLLAATLEEWVRSDIKGLPFGFANHDHEIVRSPAR